MQYTEIFEAVKIEKFIRLKLLYVFLNFAQNIDCGYTFEYPQSMFWSKNKKKGMPLHTPVYQLKKGYKGVYITWNAILMC